MNIQLFDFSVDLLQALLWQYNDAPIMQSLVNAKQDWYTENQTDFWQNWYTDVFNLATANDFGLAVWAIILNLPIEIGTAADGNKPVFGFGPFSNGYFNFGRGYFSSDDGLLELTTEEKRLVLRLRYYKLISRGSIPDTNRFLAFIIPTFTTSGTIYVVDNLNMTITYVFTFTPPPRLIPILTLYDVLPRPAGVSVLTSVI